MTKIKTRKLRCKKSSVRETAEQRKARLAIRCERQLSRISDANVIDRHTLRAQNVARKNSPTGILRVPPQIVVRGKYIPAGAGKNITEKRESERRTRQAV